MKGKKKIALVLLAIMLGFMLNGCAESSSDKMARLEKEADEAWEKARKAQDDYRKLYDFVNKYGK